MIWTNWIAFGTTFQSLTNEERFLYWDRNEHKNLFVPICIGTILKMPCRTKISFDRAFLLLLFQTIRAAAAIAVHLLILPLPWELPPAYAAYEAPDGSP